MIVKLVGICGVNVNRVVEIAVCVTDGVNGPVQFVSTCAASAVSTGDTDSSCCRVSTCGTGVNSYVHEISSVVQDNHQVAGPGVCDAGLFPGHAGLTENLIGDEGRRSRSRSWSRWDTWP